jgi:hypothetical protein
LAEGPELVFFLEKVLLGGGGGEEVKESKLYGRIVCSMESCRPFVLEGKHECFGWMGI